MRILPLSTIDDNRTILQEVLRLRKYLEENPIRNIFYIDDEYDSSTLAYDVSKVNTPSELDVTVSADDLLMFNNGYIALVDSVGDLYVTIDGDSAQEFIGRQGETGVGISSITKTGTSGLVDTYTIAFTNGTTSTFTVTNGANGDTGNGILSIVKTDTTGLVDTYTITFTNGTTTTFTVTNGRNGENGSSIEAIQATVNYRGYGDSTPYYYSELYSSPSDVINHFPIIFTNGYIAIVNESHPEAGNPYFYIDEGILIKGSDGVGVPAGGTDGQILAKDDSTDYQTKWINAPSGGGGALISDNLIINPTFSINQRGVTGSVSYSSTTPSANYTKDRWYLESGTITFGSTVNEENVINISGKLAQFIEYTKGKFSGKYLVCGVTVNRNIQSSATPLVKLYDNTGTKYTSVYSSFKNYHAGSDLFHQYIAIFDINSITDTNFVKFEIDNTGSSFSAYLVNAFCYLTDNKDYFSGTTPIPVISPNYNEELEKCKYYYERTNISGSAITSGFILTESIITQFTINANTKISSKRISPTFTLPASSSYKILSYTDQTGNRRTANVELNELTYINENGIYTQLSITHNISGIGTYSITSLLDVSSSVRYIIIDAEIYS